MTVLLYCTVSTTLLSLLLFLVLYILFSIYTTLYYVFSLSVFSEVVLYKTTNRVVHAADTIPHLAVCAPIKLRQKCNATRISSLGCLLHIIYQVTNVTYSECMYLYFVLVLYVYVLL